MRLKEEGGAEGINAGGMLGGTATRKRHRRVSYVLREEEGR